MDTCCFSLHDGTSSPCFVSWQSFTDCEITPRRFASWLRHAADPSRDSRFERIELVWIEFLLAVFHAAQSATPSCQAPILQSFPLSPRDFHSRSLLPHYTTALRCVNLFFFELIEKKFFIGFANPFRTSVFTTKFL